MTKYESDMDAAAQAVREESERSSIEQAEEMTAYPEIVQRYLEKPGAQLLGVFKVVGNTDQAEAWHRTRMRAPKGHLTTTISIGASTDPDREDWLVSEPWDFGKKATGSFTNIGGETYPMEAA